VYEKPKRSIIRSGTARLKRRKLFPDSKPNEHTQVASPRSSPTGSSLRESTRTSEQLVDANDQTQDADDGLPSPITSNDLRLGDDLELDTASGEDLLMEEADTDQSKGSGTSSLHLGGRSIRARPRVSYVEQFPDDPSDLTAEDESESDVYVSPATDEESEAEIELVSPEDEDEESAISDVGSLDIMLDEESIAVEDDNPKPKPRRQHKPGESTRAGKGIDLSLPPLSSIQECMSDLTTKAVQLGLCEALKSLGERPIRVATVCSDTESPLLALDEISKALVARGHTPMQIQQEFSAEIEVIKQGYIERNFAPNRLFRDVRDFIRESATTAITAYGAEVDIPTDVDILVAGFVCKDLSRLNSRGKTLDDGGESGDTFQGMYAYTDRFRPSIVLLENVKNEKKTWDDVVRTFDRIGYKAQWIYCDTKNYYLPQTRERMYMIAIERTLFGKGVKSATSQWKDLMQNFERQCSSPYEAFLPESLKESSGYSLLKNEPDWALCKLRNDHIRSEKRLGILSPISRRSDNGTVL
jgi:hypothetical protein